MYLLYTTYHESYLAEEKTFVTHMNKYTTRNFDKFCEGEKECY